MSDYFNRIHSTARILADEGHAIKTINYATGEIVFVVGMPDDRLSRVRAIVAEGKHIHAIKLYRELFGATLREAKDVVDSLRAGKTP